MRSIVNIYVSSASVFLFVLSVFLCIQASCQNAACRLLPVILTHVTADFSPSSVFIQFVAYFQVIFSQCYNYGQMNFSLFRDFCAQ